MGSPELQSLYQQVILDHSREKHGFGLGDAPDASSHQINTTCGDEITLQLHLESNGESGAPVVREITWEGVGCSISLASASLLTDVVRGLPLAEVSPRIDLFRELMQSRGAGVDDDEPLGDAAVLEGVSKYVARVKCAMLSWVALEHNIAQVTAR